MHRVLGLMVLPVSALLLVSGCGGGDDKPAATSTSAGASSDAGIGTQGTPGGGNTVRLVKTDGSTAGTATFAPGPHGGTRVSVEVTSMAPGFHGMHVHAIGVCEPKSASPADPKIIGDFMSAGGHLGAGTAGHGSHDADLPSLLVTKEGRGSLTAITDAFAPADLLDADGSALIVHQDRDNFANIPPRYAPEGPDKATLDTGDSGARIACGRIAK